MTNLNRRTLMKAGGALGVASLLTPQALAMDPLKVAFVYLTSVGDHGWTYAHEQGRLELVEHFGDKITTTVVENVAEGPDSERVIRNLAEEGYDMIFTTSFGYMNPILKLLVVLKTSNLNMLQATSKLIMWHLTMRVFTKVARFAATLLVICQKLAQQATLLHSQFLKL